MNLINSGQNDSRENSATSVRDIFSAPNEKGICGNALENLVW